MKKNTVFVVHAFDAGDVMGFPKIVGNADAVRAAVAEYVEAFMRLEDHRPDASRAMFKIEVREVDVREE